MIESVKDKCTGCRACITMCAKHAITIVLDEYGYEYPKVNPDVCVECGMCERVCPALHSGSDNHCLKCGAAYAVDAKMKFEGASGGLFGLIASRVIAEGGIVFGAAFDDKLQLSTTSAETLDDLLPLCKSKYLLCNTNNQFCRIEQELVKGRKVLYCSSPCQIKALKLYLRKEYHNLILVDFVCHGVGSQSLFDKSVNYVEEKIKGKMKSFMFRYKKSNASSHHYYYYDYLKSNKLLHKSGIYMQFPYYYAYQKYIIYRDSCYKCQYASEYRQGDITIADFHTIDKYVKGVDRFAGTSMFVCNTEKGLALFNLLSEQLKVFELPWEEVKKNNRFGGEEKKRQLRFDFLKSLKEDAFSTTVRKYLDYRKDWRYYYYMLPKFIQKIGCKLFLRG